MINNLYEEIIKIVEHNEGNINAFELSLNNFLYTIQGTWDILTNPESYGTMDPQGMYLLLGSLGLILIALVMIPLVVRQPAVKYVERKSWVRS